MQKYRYLRNVTTLQLDQAKCNGCGLCLEVCPQQVFSITNQTSTIVDRDACMECGACARNCPVEAIYVRQGVGCAYAVLAEKFGIKRSCCGDASCCTLEDYK